MNKEQEEGKGMRRRWGRGGGAENSVIKEISYLLFAQGIRGEDCVFAGSGGEKVWGVGSRERDAHPRASLKASRGPLRTAQGQQPRGESGRGQAPARALDRP